MVLKQRAPNTKSKFTQQSFLAGAKPSLEEVQLHSKQSNGRGGRTRREAVASKQKRMRVGRPAGIAVAPLPGLSAQALASPACFRVASCRHRQVPPEPTLVSRGHPQPTTHLGLLLSCAPWDLQQQIQPAISSPPGIVAGVLDHPRC